MANSILLEVCVDSVASAVAAEHGGGQRVELCSALIEGGVTPSSGLIESVRGRVSIPLHVMIRPRGGDFHYDADEFSIMRLDIETARRLGADGVVFGLLDAGGNVDVERTRQLIDLARPLAVTFHRGFDMTRDLLRALEDICGTGADRILTSGGEATAVEGVAVIERLVKVAGDRIGIMAGCGINAGNVGMLIQQTGVREIHVGLRSNLPSPMQYRNSRISMGSVEGREYKRFMVRVEDVRKLRQAATNSLDVSTQVQQQDGLPQDTDRGPKD